MLPSVSRHPVIVTELGSGAAVAGAALAGAVLAGAAFAGAALAGAFAGVLVCADVLTCAATSRSAHNAAVPTVMFRVISQSSSFVG